METILFATDFTGCSENAQMFATELAKKTYARLLVLHAFSLPLIEPPVATFYTDTLTKEVETEAEENVKRVVDKIKKEKYLDGKNLKVEGFVEPAPASEKINDYAAKMNADLVVLGSKGVDVFTRLVGSTTIDVASSCQKPVFVVPSRAKWHGFQTIVYASNLKNDDRRGIKEAISFAEKFNAKLKVINIDKDDYWLEKEEFEDMKKSIMGEVEFGKVEFEQIQVHDANEGVDLVVQLEHADLLVIMKQKRSFIQSIFHKSFTKKEIYHSETPLLILHS